MQSFLKAKQDDLSALLLCGILAEQSMARHASNNKDLARFLSLYSKQVSRYFALRNGKLFNIQYFVLSFTFYWILHVVRYCIKVLYYAVYSTVLRCKDG